LIAAADPEHRGRFQAQGGRGKGLEESEAWAQPTALLAADGRILLTTLQDRIANPEAEIRKDAFAQAFGFIDIAEAAGGIGPIKKSFPRGRLRRTDPRVDVEVQKGIAFTPPPEDEA
jgi:hypothetical protein